MGLLKAGIGALSGALADQWREYFYCEALPADILLRKGQKRSGNRSSNTKASDDIISNGSIVAVNEGQFMAIVDQGKVVEFSDEPGEFVYDQSSEPSLFYGGFGKGLLDSFKLVGKRFSFGGDTGRDQRVYYFNKKEIVGNKYGTSNPIPFRVVDQNIGLDIDLAVRCFGEYSYKIVDPLKFFAFVAGNVPYEYPRSQIDSQLKTELMTALQPAFAKISQMGIRYSALPGHTDSIASALNEVLSEKWTEMRGLAVASFGISSITAPEEDEQIIKQLQRAAVLRDPNMAAASLASAQAQAMQDAAKNESAGPVMAFAGMNMANAAGGSNAQSLFAMGSQKPAGGWICSCGRTNEESSAFCTSCGSKKPESKTWVCSCGEKSVGKFCTGCGKPRPEDSEGWDCPKCKARSKGKFCTECGEPKPKDALLYRCDKCGWEPKDPTNPPKFCPECGDPFNEQDVK